MNSKRALPVGLAVVALALFAACTTEPAAPTRVESRATSLANKERSADVHLELAGMYLGRGQAGTALDEIKQVLAVKPDYAPAFDMQGLILASQGKAADADASFERALRLDPTAGSTMHNYGWFLCQEKDYARADAQFAAALALPAYRDTVRTLLARGVCQARAGQWAQAEHTLAHSYELDPANPATAYNLSDVLLHRGELERARFYVGRINANRQQSTAQSLWLAARIEHRAGNVQGARALGVKLSERFPNSPEALRFGAGKYDE
jgi:type IV pilus assembly protein PilF